jgi:hypothetical protein
MEAAAPAVALIADVAMSLAAWTDLGIAREVIRSYRAGGGDDTTIEPPDLGQSMMIGLDWVAFNVERACGQQTRRRPAWLASADQPGSRPGPGFPAAIPVQAVAAARISR